MPSGRSPGAPGNSAAPTPEAISDGRVELFADQARDFDPFMPEDRPLLRLETTSGQDGGAGRTEKLRADLFIGRPMAGANRPAGHAI